MCRGLEAGPAYVMDELTSPELIDSPELHISIHALYSCCLDALKSISAVELHDERFKTYYARLKIWGAGLFTEGPSIDEILEEEPERYGPLLSSLQKTLFSIAVEEGRFSLSESPRISINLAVVVFLKSRWAPNGNYNINLQLEPQTKTLLDLVSQNNTTVSTCERRLPHLANTSNIGTLEPLTFQSSPSQDIRPSSSNRRKAREVHSWKSQGVIPGLVNRIRKKFPAANGVISLFTREDTVDCHHDYDMYFGDFVESLFDLLPSIRGIRRTRLLEIEFHQSNERSSGPDLIRQATPQSARTLPGSKIPSDRDNPESAQRFSSAPSDRGSTLLGSDNDNSRLMSGDEDDIDARSETIYDSTRTGATGSSHSGIRRPPIDTIFDESPPPDLPHKSNRITKKSLPPPSYSDRLPSSYTATAFGFSMSDLLLTRNLALRLYSRYLEGAHGAGESTFYCCSPVL